MTKAELMEKLRKELSFLPSEELESRLSFYSEMIDDRMEEGLSEGDAVAAIGDLDEIISQLKTELSPSPKAKPQGADEQKQSKPKGNKTRVWIIILIALGSPIWISLGAAALSIVISAYAVIWAVAGSLWALPVSLAGVFVGGLAVGVASVVAGSALSGVTLIGVAIACAGLSIFAGFGCFHLTRLAVFLSKAIARGIISLFARKEKKNA